MTQELLYTSAPRGLLPGSQGFCTVSATRGLNATMREALESISGYRPQFGPDDPRNPVAYSHLRLAIGGSLRSVLSRIGPLGLDYTGRTNKLAHHIVLDGTERPTAGPASLLKRNDIFQSTWDGQVGWRPNAPDLANGAASFGKCHEWARVTGDAGWAGAVADSFVNNPARPIVFVFPPGMGLLTLIDEVLSLLQPVERWSATFTTYYSALPPSVECRWRGVPVRSKEAKAMARMPGALVLDLAAPLGAPIGSALVDAARTGRAPQLAARATTPQPTTWDTARSDDIAPPPTPLQRGSAWPEHVIPPPPTPSEMDFLSTRFADDPPRSHKKLIVLLVLLLVLFTGLGVGAFLTMMPRETKPVSDPSQMTANDRSRLGNVQYAARVMTFPSGPGLAGALSISMHCFETNEANDQYKSAQRAQSATPVDKPQVAQDVLANNPVRPMPTEPKAPQTNGANGRKVKAANDTDSASPPPNPPSAPPNVASQNTAPKAPTLKRIPLLEMQGKENGYTKPVDMRGVSANSQLEVLVPPNSNLLRVEQRGSGEAVVQALKKNSLDPTKGFERDFVHFRLSDGHLIIKLLDPLKGESGHWCDLIDSLLVLKGPSGEPLYHVALRELDYGHAEPNPAKDSTLTMLKWSSQFPARWPLYIRNITIEKSTDVDTGKPVLDEKGNPKKDSDGKTQTKYELSPVQFTASVSDQQVHEVQLIPRVEPGQKASEALIAKIAFDSGSYRLLLTSSGSKIPAANYKVIAIELFREINNVSVPVLQIRKTTSPKAPKAAEAKPK